jgi:hypothetical protein
MSEPSVLDQEWWIVCHGDPAAGTAWLEGFPTREEAERWAAHCKDVFMPVDRLISPEEASRNG